MQKQIVIRNIWLAASSVLVALGCYTSLKYGQGNESLTPILLLALLACPSSVFLIVILLFFSKFMGQSKIEIPLYFDFIIYLLLFACGYFQWFKIFPFLNRKYGRKPIFNFVALSVALMAFLFKRQFKCGEELSMCSNAGGTFFNTLIITGIASCALILVQYARDRKN